MSPALLTPQTVILVWLVCGIVVSIWARVTRWDELGETLVEFGYQDTTATRTAYVVLAGALWFVFAFAVLFYKKDHPKK